MRPYYLEYLDKGQWFKFFKAKHKGKYQPHYLAGLAFLKALRSLGIKSNFNLGKVYQKHFGSRSLQTQLKHLSEVFSKDYLTENKNLQQA